MADLIQLLPDAIANQIAAGEVIQRPASVVKELMENAIDAGSTSIKLIVKEAGKGLIQVIDNGCGMSETDARMAFERHATSKIRQANDLFAIRTMGFRGEAMASIAAVAQVEMRTRRQADELGTRLVIEGSEVKSQEYCQCTAGTNISVKNLFFNVPARRNFLKSHTVEMRHIIDEFQRLAIANPDIFFSLHHNNNEVFHLPAGPIEFRPALRQRVIGIFGNNVNKKLVPVQEDTDVLKITGFVGKPEFAKKTRGEQLFFVNRRFIKSAYLAHAVQGAYEDILQKDTHPLYIIFIDIDPNKIDINVHPTKQEVKFDDERLVYNYLKVAVRHGLGQSGVMPSLDFDQDVNFYPPTEASTRGRNVVPERRSSRESNYSSGGSFARDYSKEKVKDWQEFYEELNKVELPTVQQEQESVTIESNWSSGNDTLDDQTGSFSKPQKIPYQIHTSYIVSQIKSGFIIVDQQAAHERILYEEFLQILNEQTASTQKQLFPRMINLSPSDAVLLREILDQINLLGFDMQEFGDNAFVINGMPGEFVGKRDEQAIVEALLEQYKQNVQFKLDVKENIARSMARSAAIKRGQSLTAVEMQALIDKLFGCEVILKSPSGRNTLITFELEELEKRFNG